MDLLLVGLNHTTAPVETRERLAFSEEEVPKVLPELRDRMGAREALLLSTCNRTEIIAAFDLEKEPSAGVSAIAALCALRGGVCEPNPEMLYEHHEREAVRHVFRVAAGLDSMVLGEPQILGQVKQAYTQACQAGTTGLYLNKVFHMAFRAGKRVRTETELGYGALSVGAVAVVLAAKVFGNLTAHTALIVGAGEMAQAAALHLKEQGIRELTFINRTPEKATDLAAKFEAQWVPFSMLFEALENADIVISSTGAPGFILTHETFHAVMAKRHTRPIFLVDIAVPRDIDPAIDAHTNAFLYDIDSLRQVADHNLERRKKAIPAAEKVIEAEIAAFLRWQAGLVTEPVVKLLYERFDNARRSAVTKYAKRFCDKEVEDLEKLTRLIQNKQLHRTAEVLKHYDPNTEEGQQALSIICKLFDLR